MLDEKTRMAVALKRFSIISPIVNGQVESITEYCVEVTKDHIDMPHYGPKKYAPRTVETWYSAYVKEGLDGLKPQSRSDEGIPRVIDADTAKAILEKLKEFPKAPTSKIYDMLVDEQVIMRKDVSIATLRRFVKANKDIIEAESVPKQMLRFSQEKVNAMWQTDVMFGPYVGSKKKKATYLLAYIDDASRLVTYAAFYHSQDIKVLRDSFKEACLRRGIPKILYTDNGKIYRSQAFEYLCANIGVTLLHHGVYQAHMKGKIERFFRTVRSRFLSCLKYEELTDIDVLNERFQAWLLDDYQKQPHSGLNGETPMEFFLNRTQEVVLVTDLADFNEKFLLSVKRTVKKDATISLNGELYETDMILAGKKVEVRYDPEEEIIKELFIFYEDKSVAVARLVDMHVNSRRKRIKSYPGHDKDGSFKTSSVTESEDEKQLEQKEHTISYSSMKGDG